jgi:hypothetical protein
MLAPLTKEGTLYDVSGLEVEGPVANQEQLPGGTLAMALPWPWLVTAVYSDGKSMAVGSL